MVRWPYIQIIFPARGVMVGIVGSTFSLSTLYQGHRDELQKSIARLASGDRYANLGEEVAAGLSMSERFRLRIRNAEASTNSIQAAQAYLDTTDAYAQSVTGILQRMMELASSAADNLKLDSDRHALDTEFQSLKAEISEMTRQSQFLSKQTISREGMVSYDANSGLVRFWQATGDDPHRIERDFSSGALDASQNLIGFDPSESYSMSRDGKSLLFMGTVDGDAPGAVRVKRYDIESQTVTYGGELFASGDTLFVDDQGQVYANGSGTFYSVDSHSLSRSATAVVDGKAGQEFTVYEGKIIYSRAADGAITSADPGTGSATALTGALVFGAGTDHTFASSGRFVAEESAAGTIRVIDTRSGNEAMLNLGPDASVNDLQFNADGDRIYYINQETRAIHYVSVGTDENDNVIISSGEKLVQGVNANSFNGLSLGGSGWGSSISYALAQDTISVLSYEAIDLSLYNLGLANLHVDTLSDANGAIESIREAMTRLSAERAKVGAMASRFKFVLSSHENYTANLKNVESQIRDTDVAEETMRFSAAQVNQTAATAIIAQFNTLSKNVLTLLQG
jgi:flagellin